MGSGALLSNTGGSNNTATGVNALSANITGGQNTATGAGALNSNTTGINNTATGVSALLFSTTASNDTANGANALANNTIGANNTATGSAALAANKTGGNNTADGFEALLSNTGSNNTATGANALAANTTGGFNTALGVQALQKSSTGIKNTGVGAGALINNTVGSNNVALGASAGVSLTSGSNNIDISNPGVAAEAGRIRIGVQGVQTAAFIAGIRGVAVTGGLPVEVASTGQLGIAMSSARYKHDIRNLGGASANLLKLRPVSFRYNNDPSDAVQYGLVAEEVAKVYPELVAYGTDGKPMTVRYSMLSAMLLNELQKQTLKIARQQQEMGALEKRLSALEQAKADRRTR